MGWGELPESPADRAAVVLALVSAAVAVRRGQFQNCESCGGSFPREHRLGPWCHPCASREMGIVY